MGIDTTDIQRMVDWQHHGGAETVIVRCHWGNGGVNTTSPLIDISEDADLRAHSGTMAAFSVMAQVIWPAWWASLPSLPLPAPVDGYTSPPWRELVRLYYARL